MTKLRKILKGGVLAAFFALLIVSPVLASSAKCSFDNNNQLNAVGLSTSEGGDYQVKCPLKVSTNKGGVPDKVLYGKSQADCARLGSLTTKDDWCKDTDLTTAVSFIINTIVFIVGMLAVVMIVIGGINYATSQGDPGKVKKAKDTILYGIIGLVVALLAFAIVQFVLNALQSS